MLAYGCADARQAVVWLLRGRDGLDAEGDLEFRPLLRDATVELPGLDPGRYVVTCMETHCGHTLGEIALHADGGSLCLSLPPFRHDLAVAVRPAPG